MPIAKANGIDLFYQVFGKGPPVLILPDIGCDHTWADPLLLPLKKHFEVLLLDLRGVGMSSAPEGAYTVDMMASDVMELVHKQGWKKPHILGYSLGGAIAQKLMHDYPNAFSKLILISSAMQFLKPSQMLLEIVEELYAIHAPREMIVKQLIACCHSHQFLSQRSHLQSLFDRMVETPHFQTPMGFKGQLSALKQFDSRKWVKMISNPTLIIAGDEDLMTPIEQAYDLHEAMEGSHMVILPGSGHGIATDQEKLLIEHVIEFLVEDVKTTQSITAL